MSLVSQVRILLTKLADGIDSLSIDVKGLRGALEKLKLIEDVHLYTKAIVQFFTDLNDDLKYMDKVIDEYNIQLIDKCVKNLENRIHYMVTSIAKSKLGMEVLMPLTILLLTIVNIIISYSFVYYLGVQSLILTILSMAIGSIVLVGFSLRFLSTLFLIPSIPLIPLIQLTIILTRERVDDYILALALIFSTGCILFISVNVIFYIIRTYKSAIFAFLNFGQIVESLLSKISRIEMKKISSSAQNLVKDYEKIYGNEAYELIKYIEELSKTRG
ncbi:MAG: hypothetical protein QXN35_02100 [Ignisphaera sp.]